jgi:hypothetical protein
MAERANAPVAHDGFPACTPPTCIRVSRLVLGPKGDPFDTSLEAQRADLPMIEAPSRSSRTTVLDHRDPGSRTHVLYRGPVRWRREWVYQLRWAPGYTGVLSRGVDSPVKLRAVVEWARRNPRGEVQLPDRVPHRRPDGQPLPGRPRPEHGERVATVPPGAENAADALRRLPRPLRDDVPYLRRAGGRPAARSRLRSARRFTPQ